MTTVVNGVGGADLCHVPAPTYIKIFMLPSGLAPGRGGPLNNKNYNYFKASLAKRRSI